MKCIDATPTSKPWSLVGEHSERRQSRKRQIELPFLSSQPDCSPQTGCLSLSYCRPVVKTRSWSKGERCHPFSFMHAAVQVLEPCAGGASGSVSFLLRSSSSGSSPCILHLGHFFRGYPCLVLRWSSAFLSLQLPLLARTAQVRHWKTFPGTTRGLDAPLLGSYHSHLSCRQPHTLFAFCF